MSNMLVTNILQRSVLLRSLSPRSVQRRMITVNLQDSMLLMVTVTLKGSVPYDHCHSAVFSAPYGHRNSATYRHSAVVMNVPDPCTTSRQNDAAASHSCHFNTVLYPRSYCECQLILNRSRCGN